jgi:hypothetical protein
VIFCKTPTIDAELRRAAALEFFIKVEKNGSPEKHSELQSIVGAVNRKHLSIYIRHLFTPKKKTIVILPLPSGYD